MPAAIDKDESIQKEGKRIELVKDSPKQFAASGAVAASAPAHPDKRADVSPLHAERTVAQAQETSVSSFNEEEVIHDLQHYLPSQAPLKDFIHHNTLHAFQNYPFHEGTRRAKKIFGYFPSLQLREYRDLYEAGRIRKDILERIISEQKGAQYLEDWMQRLLEKEYDDSVSPRIGKLRANWKRHYPIDLDLMVHPLLFRILCSYLDQGISIWGFPIGHKGFLAAMKEMEEKSFASFFKTKRAKKLLVSGNCKMEDLLKLVVGDETLYAQYLFDQQFAHPGWSGMVASVEAQPASLLNPKNITVHDLVIFELLLEIDALDSYFGESWQPIAHILEERPEPLFDDVPETEVDTVFSLWQDAFEWTYYDQVLTGIALQDKTWERKIENRSFQTYFCIDDRLTSFRRYLEQLDPDCETFTTAGFFNVELYYQPENGKFYTKCCPAPVFPKFLVKEIGNKQKIKKEVHFSKLTHSLFQGWFISQTIGFVSALRLALNVFKPGAMPAMASSYSHVDKDARLTIENKDPNDKENGLQIGYTIDEMVQRVQGVLTSTGLNGVDKTFAPIVYMIGHGASSVNNPHYTAYDCGACGGRPGSVNARTFCYMANHPKVREALKERGVVIPPTTQFLPGLHDTTRDEVAFFDEEILSEENAGKHRRNTLVINEALDLHAKERSRRLVSIDTKMSPKEIHEEIRRRSVSLFEPRPELNHATNAVSIIGRRSITENLFLDRRASTSTYDYRTDPEGKFLTMSMGPIALVMGGIDLEYFFSRTDNHKMGAGTKLPHNVMGLIGVANGADGDLRTGLPSQMIEIHDPVRLLVIIEHYPDVALKVIKSQTANYSFYENYWVHCLVVHPDTGELWLYKDGSFSKIYKPLLNDLETVSDLSALMERAKKAESIETLDAVQENLPVYFIEKKERVKK
ncbi:hypothetical protein C8R21_107113 [Nitrosospira multiformis]|uniref:Uncharacterized protein n=1 Tax=Nitrosospira multiformis TaxID=1231 RepID=A0A2T5IDM3_9PROT|nr:DUF2309 domain-containing protein [Nitrosospira multiformis]PTQ81932.1 hypothetical protein C8R21_107113 [Nitrosospira multiformis]